MRYRERGVFARGHYQGGFLSAVVDEGSLQHADLQESERARPESRVSLCPAAHFSTAASPTVARCTARTAAFAREPSSALRRWNASDASVPLANNGPISIWSPSPFASCMTGPNGTFVGYLAIVADKPE